MAKLLKNGKVSIKLTPATAKVLKYAIDVNLDDDFNSDDLELHLYYLLEDIREKLITCLNKGGGKVSLRRCEFFALVSEEVIRYLDEPTQILFREIVNLPPATTILSERTKIVSHEYFQKSRLDLSVL